MTTKLSRVGPADAWRSGGKFYQRLARIAAIIEAVDQRAAASDGPVTPTLQEMTQDEISEIYRLAKAGMERKKKRKDRHGV